MKNNLENIITNIENKKLDPYLSINKLIYYFIHTFVN